MFPPTIHFCSTPLFLISPFPLRSPTFPYSLYHHLRIELSQDARRAVTKVAIREARLKEIKQEMLNSTRLKSYFEDHTRDLQLLRHDKTLHTAHVQDHLQHVPDYLVPKTLRHLPLKLNKKKPTGKRNESKTKRKFNVSFSNSLHLK